MVAERPALAEVTLRMAQSRMRVEDWIAVVRADPHAAWPAVEALGPGGISAARTLDRLAADGRLTTCPAGGEPVAWTLAGGRVTCAGRSIAVGATDPLVPRRQSFVPAASVASPSAALRWERGGAPQHVAGATPCSPRSSRSPGTGTG